MIIYLYGADTFRSREKLHELIAEFKKKRDPHGHNVSVLKAPFSSAEHIAHIASSGGLLSPRRMVIVENVASHGNKEFHVQLLSLINHERFEATAENVLVFWDEIDVTEEVPGRGALKSKKIKHSSRTLHDWLVGKKYVFYFPRLNTKGVNDWIAARFKSLGMSCTRGVLEQLSQAVGEDLWKADREIQKLNAYCDSRTVRIEDVDALVEPPGEPTSIFGFLDAFAQGELPAALTYLQKLIMLGTEPTVLASQLSRTLRTLSLVKSFFEEPGEHRESELATALGIHPFVARKAYAQSKRHTWHGIRQSQDALLDLDFSIKNSGGADPALLFEITLYRLISMRTSFVLG